MHLKDVYTAAKLRAHSIIGTRPKLKDPALFKGTTLKEANDYLCSLKLIFAMSSPYYD